MRFGATVAMVEAWLPHTTISDTTEPSTDQVEQQIATFDDDVYFATGSLASLEADPARAPFLNALLTQGSRVVALGAASVVWHAKHPEGADPADGTSYGSILWKRYQQMLANLQSAANRGTDAPDSQMAPNAGPAWSRPACFPLPLTGDRPLFVDEIDPNPDYPGIDAGVLSQ